MDESWKSKTDKFTPSVISWLVNWVPTDLSVGNSKAYPIRYPFPNLNPANTPYVFKFLVNRPAIYFSSRLTVALKSRERGDPFTPFNNAEGFSRTLSERKNTYAAVA